MSRLFLVLLVAIIIFSGFGSVNPAAAGESRSGIAMYYMPGIMARVASNRHMKMRTDVDGWAAVLNCSDIGKVVVATINGHKAERYQVLDCSQPRDRARHIQLGLIIEVDYASAVRLGFAGVGRAKATILDMQNK
jgi:hypothetical protein